MCYKNRRKPEVVILWGQGTVFRRTQVIYRKVAAPVTRYEVCAVIMV